MPIVTQAQTIQAINTGLAEMDPPGTPIDSLDTNEMSNPRWSCNTFAPAVLEAICKLRGVDCGGIETVRYRQGDPNLPNAFADGSFVNISMLGEPSALNHNFNLFVSGGTTYLIQAFCDRRVNIVRRSANAVFIANWHNLSNNVNWTGAYTTLFGVAPADVVQDPPRNTWLQTQYVTQ